MNNDVFEVDIKELITLLKVPVVKQDIAAKLMQSKWMYREEIGKYFEKTSLKVAPLPLKGTENYSFRLERKGRGADRLDDWEVIIENNEKYLPVESILPRPVVEFITGQRVGFEITHIKKNFECLGSVYNLFFVRATENLVTGTVQRVLDDKEMKEFPVFDVAQFTALPESAQLEILKYYLDNHPGIRKETLFYFFTRILPFSKVLDEIA